MNKSKKIAFYLVIVMVVALGAGLAVSAFTTGTPENVTVMENVTIETFNEASEAEVALGSITGPDIYHPQIRLHGRTMIGGAVLASSTDLAATTLTVKQVLDYKQLDYTVSSVANSLTLPATSTFVGFMDVAGNCYDFKIRNVTATAASSTTIVAGTGMDLVENENGDVIIEGGNEARITMCRELDTDITVSVDEYIAAD